LGNKHSPPCGGRGRAKPRREVKKKRKKGGEKNCGENCTINGASVVGGKREKKNAQGGQTNG